MASYSATIVGLYCYRANHRLAVAVLILVLSTTTVSCGASPGVISWRSIPPPSATGIAIVHNEKIAKVTFEMPFSLEDAYRVFGGHLLITGWSRCKMPNSGSGSAIDYGEHQRAPNYERKNFWVTDDRWWGQATLQGAHGKETRVVFKAVNYVRSPSLRPSCG